MSQEPLERSEQAIEEARAAADEASVFPVGEPDAPEQPDPPADAPVQDRAADEPPAGTPGEPSDDASDATPEDTDEAGAVGHA